MDIGLMKLCSGPGLEQRTGSICLWWQRTSNGVPVLVKKISLLTYVGPAVGQLPGSSLYLNPRL